MKQDITDKLRVSLVQTRLSWEDRDSNLDHISNLLKSVRKGKTDVIILPEMFASGFTMNGSRVAETMKGPSIEWMKKTASEKSAVICGSLVIRSGKNLYNRFVWVHPEGRVQHYDKRHLFGMAGEDKVYTPGSSKKIFELNGWKVLPQVCYDLRFPVFSRNTSGYDLAIYVANWPEKRRKAWENLLIARAIENQAYIVGVNRVGSDENGFRYRGGSSVSDPLGESAGRIPLDKVQVLTIELDKWKIYHTRRTLPFLKDMDTFKINL